MINGKGTFHSSVLARQEVWEQITDKMREMVQIENSFIAKSESMISDPETLSFIREEEILQKILRNGHVSVKILDCRFFETKKELCAKMERLMIDWKEEVEIGFDINTCMLSFLVKSMLEKK